MSRHSCKESETEDVVNKIEVVDIDVHPLVSPLEPRLGVLIPFSPDHSFSLQIAVETQGLEQVHQKHGYKDPTHNHCKREGYREAQNGKSHRHGLIRRLAVQLPGGESDLERREHRREKGKHDDQPPEGAVEERAVGLVSQSVSSQQMPGNKPGRPAVYLVQPGQPQLAVDEAFVDALQRVRVNVPQHIPDKRPPLDPLRIRRQQAGLLGDLQVDFVPNEPDVGEQQAARSRRGPGGRTALAPRTRSS